MRIAVLLALMVVFGLAQESRPESRSASQPVAQSRPAASLRDLVDVGQDIVDALKGDRSRAFRAADRVVQEGFALHKEGRDDEALKCFERLGKEFPETHTTISWMLVVSVHQDRGDLDAAVQVVEHALAESGDDDYKKNLAYIYLGMLQERRGDWRKALEATEKVKPLEADDYLGNERQFRIVRCRFHLGEVDAALKLMETCLRTAGAADGPYAELNRMGNAEMAAIYAEYSGRSGRLAEARKFAATLPVDRRTLVLDSVKVVEAWLTKDAAAVLKVVAETNLDEQQIRAAGRLLGELGPPAIELLTPRIAAGDPTSIKLAGASGRRELLEPLQKRSAIDPDSEAVAYAIQTLEAAASRPASRRTK